MLADTCQTPGMTNTDIITILIWAAGPDEGQDIPYAAEIAVTVWDNLDTIIEARHDDGEWYEVREVKR